MISINTLSANMDKRFNDISTSLSTLKKCRRWSCRVSGGNRTGVEYTWTVNWGPGAAVFKVDCGVDTNVCKTGQFGISISSPKYPDSGYKRKRGARTVYQVRQDAASEGLGRGAFSNIRCRWIGRTTVWNERLAAGQEQSLPGFITIRPRSSSCVWPSRNNRWSIRGHGYLFAQTWQRIPWKSGKCSTASEKNVELWRCGVVFFRQDSLQTASRQRSRLQRQRTNLWATRWLTGTLKSKFWDDSFESSICSVIWISLMQMNNKLSLYMLSDWFVPDIVVRLYDFNKILLIAQREVGWSMFLSLLSLV